MATIVFPYNLVAGQNENVDDLNANLAALLAGVNAVSGDRISAGALNAAHFSDEAWTAYEINPHGATVNGTFTKYGVYIKYGKTVHVRGRLAFGAGSSISGGDLYFDVPFTARNNTIWTPGSAIAWDNSLSKHAVGNCQVQPNSKNLVFWMLGDADDTPDGATSVSSNSPFPSWGDGDAIDFAVTYEAA